MEQNRQSISDWQENILASVKPTPTPSVNALVVSNADGSDIFSDIKWDLITPTYNTTSDVYVFSLLWVTTATIIMYYTDSTKDVLLRVTKA